MKRLLTDGQGRQAEYLRISVTDRCDLRCSYCMPPGGAELKPRCEILQYRELLTLIEVFASMGVRKVRITGGEPLIRKGIIGFTRQVGRIDGIERMALTTNGTRLKEMAGLLKKAGLLSVNISLDTFKTDRFKSITHRDSLQSVLDGIDASIAAGFDAVKVNMVVMRGANDDEIGDFIAFAREKQLQVRFLEFMPATPSVWSEKRFVPASEIKKMVQQRAELEPLEKVSLGGPAEVYRFKDGFGEIGFISAVTHHFCDSCNRLRLTSSGELISCLFSKERVDLKSALRAGASHDDLANIIHNAVQKKNAVRTLPFDPTEDSKKRFMSGIGG